MKKFYFAARYTERSWTNMFGLSRYKTQLASVCISSDGADYHNAYCAEFSARHTDAHHDKSILDDLLSRSHVQRKPMRQIARELFNFMYDQHGVMRSAVVVVTNGDPMQAWWFRRLWVMACTEWDESINILHSIGQDIDITAEMLPDEAFGPSSEFTLFLDKPDDVSYSHISKRQMVLSHVRMPTLHTDVTAYMQAMTLKSMDITLTKIRREFTQPLANEVYHNEQQEKD